MRCSYLHHLNWLYYLYDLNHRNISPTGVVTGWLWGELKVGYWTVIGWLWGGYGVVMGWLWGGYRLGWGVISWLWDGYSVVKGWLWGGYEVVTW